MHNDIVTICQIVDASFSESTIVKDVENLSKYSSL